MNILGVDPGRTSGAAVVLVDGRTVRRWWTWKFLESGFWRVSFGAERERGEFNVPSMWKVGDVVAAGAEPDVTLVMEGLFVPRARGSRPVNPQTVVPLAEAAGELIGGLRMTPEFRPLATEWRSGQLGLRRSANAAGAEDYAVRMAPGVFAWPECQAPRTKEERGALAESAFIARHGWTVLGNRRA